MHSLVASSSYDQTVKIYDTRSAQTVSSIQQQHGTQHSDPQANALAFIPGGTHLAVGTWQKLSIFDVASSQPVLWSVFPNATRNITAVGFEGPQPRWAYAGGEDGQCRIFEFRGSQLSCQKAFEVGAGITSIVLHVNGVELFVADQSGAVHLWELPKKDSHEPIKMPDLELVEFVTKLAVNPRGGSLVGITNRGRLLVWSLEEDLEPPPEGTQFHQTYPSTKVTFRFSKFIRRCCGLSIRFSPRGDYFVITFSDNIVSFLNSETFEEINSLNVDCEWNWDALFTSDGRLLLTGGADNKVKVWDTETGALKKKFDGHTKPIIALCSNDC